MENWEWILLSFIIVLLLSVIMIIL